jgi:positive regulator of sigma E activity
MKLKYLAPLFFLLISTLVNAQSAAEVEMADTFRSEGKIYVVVAVVLTILIGLFIYLIRLDRKLQRLEKDKMV